MRRRDLPGTSLGRGLPAAPAVGAEVNGRPRQCDIRYDKAAQTLSVSGIATALTDAVRISLETEKESLLADTDRRAAKLHKLLRAFRLNTRVKCELDQRMTELVAGPGLLAQYESALTRSQLQALIEVINGLHEQKLEARASVGDQ